VILGGLGKTRDRGFGRIVRPRDRQSARRVVVGGSAELGDCRAHAVSGVDCVESRSGVPNSSRTTAKARPGRRRARFGTAQIPGASPNGARMLPKKNQAPNAARYEIAGSPIRRAVPSVGRSFLCAVAYRRGVDGICDQSARQLRPAIRDRGLGCPRGRQQREGFARDDRGLVI